MSAAVKPLQEAAIHQYAKQLRLPTRGGQFARLAGEAAKEKQSHLSYLEALLEAELEERDRKAMRSEEHTSELQSRRDLHSFPTRRSSDLVRTPGRGSGEREAIPPQLSGSAAGGGA